MRNKILISLILAIAVTFAGCNVPVSPHVSTPPVSNQTSVPPSVGTTAPAWTEPADSHEYDGPMLAVSMPVVTQEKTARSNGTVIYYDRFQNVMLTTDATQSVQNIELDLLNRLEALKSVKTDVYETAQNDYKDQSYWYPYRTSVTYDITRIDNTLISFLGTEEVFDGTPRSSTIRTSVTYNLSSGQVLTLKNILRDDFSADTLCELIIEGLHSYSEDSLFGDYKSIIADMFNTNVPVDSWYLSNTELVFFFNPYEIAPHALGTVYSAIPYEKLLGLIHEEYFPQEQIQYTGSIAVTAAELASGTGLQDYTRFTELNMEETTHQYLLSCQGSVTDLRIHWGVKSEDGTEFYPSATVFSCVGLGPQDAVIIHANADTICDTLAVSYVSCGKNIFMMFQLNEDGSISLYE